MKYLLYLFKPICKIITIEWLHAYYGHACEIKVPMNYREQAILNYINVKGSHIYSISNIKKYTQRSLDKSVYKELPYFNKFGIKGKFYCANQRHTKSYD